MITFRQLCWFIHWRPLHFTVTALAPAALGTWLNAHNTGASTVLRIVELELYFLAGLIYLCGLIAELCILLFFRIRWKPQLVRVRPTRPSLAELHVQPAFRHVIQLPILNLLSVKDYEGPALSAQAIKTLAEISPFNGIDIPSPEVQAISRIRSRQQEAPPPQVLSYNGTELSLVPPGDPTATGHSVQSLTVEAYRIPDIDNKP